MPRALHPGCAPLQHASAHPPFSPPQPDVVTPSRRPLPRLCPPVASRPPVPPVPQLNRGPMTIRIWEMPSLASIPPQAPGYGTYMPPINRLPPELLSRIFAEALPSQLFEATCSRRTIPLVLSHVCGYWREVALDTTTLWQWISLTECSSRRAHHTRKLPRRFVQRTKGAELSIYFMDAEAANVQADQFKYMAMRYPVEPIPAHERCPCALDFITALIPRVRELDLFIGHASTQRLSLLRPSAAKTLHNIHVDFVQGGSQVQSLCTLLSTSPKLRRFSWSNYFDICVVPPPSQIAWAQLVCAELEESPMTFQAFFNMLSVGRLLETVCVRLTRRGSSFRSLRGSVRTQYTLTKLLLCGHEALDEVFDAIWLPSLQQFTLDCNSQNSVDWPCVDTRSLHRFISSTSALHKFDITPGGTVDENAIINILSLPQAATIADLHADLSVISDRMISAMHRGQGGPLLPQLSRLSLGYCATTDGVISNLLCSVREAHGDQGYASAAMPSSSTNMPRPLHPGYAPLQHSSAYPPRMFQQPGGTTTSCLPHPHPHPPTASQPPVPQLNRGPMTIRIWEMPSLASVPPQAPGYGPYTPPINRLPPELLSRIFVEALPSQLFEATCSRRSVPLVLSHVCGYWREVALDTVTLWRWISLTECSSRRAHCTRKLARRFVQRTKGAELSIYFMDAEAASVQADHFKYMAMRYPVESIPAHDRCPCALDFITALISRVRELDLFIGHASTQRLSLLRPSASKALHNIHVDFVQGGSQVQSLCTLLSTSPNLRHFSWRNHFGICTVPPPARIAWAQLVRAEFEKSPMTFDAFFDMLSVGQSLETVCVRLTREGTSSSTSRFGGTLVQHTVTELLLYGDGALDEIFNVIRLPSLREITLDSELNNSTEWPCVDTRSLCRFISGTSALKRLQFSPCGTIAEDALIDLLSLPSAFTITDLSVDLSLVSDKLISAMHSGPGGPLVPLLSRLSLDDCATTDGVISRMLWSRFQSQSPLVYVQIGFMRTEQGRHPIDEHEFRRLSTMGLLAEGFF
ncbi:hypothetical protein K525DRAFT_191799 [Schizophyllum commune Loenen D]|nr:hypothetical protein K525DRAFT_191799 [Schizophyllum commune Loenen D]